MNRKQLYTACVDLAKRIKNANCDTKFYQSQIAKESLIDQTIQPKKQLSFEADTCSLTPFDFMRLIFFVSAD